MTLNIRIKLKSFWKAEGKCWNRLLQGCWGIECGGIKNPLVQKKKKYQEYRRREKYRDSEYIEKNPREQWQENENQKAYVWQQKMENIVSIPYTQDGICLL